MRHETTHRDGGIGREGAAATRPHPDAVAVAAAGSVRPPGEAGVGVDRRGSP